MTDDLDNADLFEVIGKCEAAFWRWNATADEDGDFKDGPEFDEYDRLEKYLINMPCVDHREVMTKINYVMARQYILDNPAYFEPLMRSLKGLEGGAE